MHQSITRPHSRRLQRSIARTLPFLAFAFLALAVPFLNAQDRALIHKVPPVYPPIAKQMGLAGTIIVTVTVDASGKVIKAESSSGTKLLVTPAIDAVKQWKFTPGDGLATFPVSVNFEKN